MIGGFRNQFAEYTIQSYFPQELFYELWRSNNDNAPGPAPAANSAPSPAPDATPDAATSTAPVNTTAPAPMQPAPDSAPSGPPDKPASEESTDPNTSKVKSPNEGEDTAQEQGQNQEETAVSILGVEDSTTSGGDGESRGANSAAASDAGGSTSIQELGQSQEGNNSDTGSEANGNTESTQERDQTQPGSEAQGSAAGGAGPANSESNPNSNPDPGPGPETNAETNAAAEVPPPKPQFDILHTIKYYPWSPVPGDERTELNVIASTENLREANELAIKEVYEKYGGLAHVVRGPFNLPNTEWIRKAGTRTGIGAWPNTWKVDNSGCLSFSVVNSKLQYTLEGKVSVVKRQWTT